MKGDVPEQISEYRRQLTALEIKLNNMVEAIADGLYNSAMKEKMAHLEESRKAVQIRIDEASLHAVKHSLTRDEIRAYLARFSGIRVMTPEQQKQAVSVFVERLTVYEDYIDMDILTTIGGPGDGTGKGPSGGADTTGGSSEKDQSRPDDRHSGDRQDGCWDLMCLEVTFDPLIFLCTHYKTICPQGKELGAKNTFYLKDAKPKINNHHKTRREVHKKIK